MVDGEGGDHLIVEDGDPSIGLEVHHLGLHHVTSPHGLARLAIIFTVVGAVLLHNLRSDIEYVG